MCIALALVSTGCGDGGPNPTGARRSLGIAFQRHSLECEREGLQAELEATGVAGVCPLRITEDRTVEGVCSVPTGEVRVFTLAYEYDAPCGELICRVRVAEIRATLDLRGVRRPDVVLEFDQADLTTDFDYDQDGRSNLVEFCAGTDPLSKDG